MYSNNKEELKQNVLENINIIEGKITFPMVEVITTTFFAYNNYSKNENIRKRIFKNHKLFCKITNFIFENFNTFNTYDIYNILKSSLIIKNNSINDKKFNYKIINKNDFYVLGENETYIKIEDIFNFEYISHFSKKIILSEDDILLSIIDSTKKKDKSPDKFAGSRNNFNYKTLGFNRKYVNNLFDLLKGRIEIINNPEDSNVYAKLKNDLPDDDKYETLSFYMFLNKNKLEISKKRTQLYSSLKNFKKIKRTKLKTYASKNNLLKEYHDFINENKNKSCYGYDVYLDQKNSKFFSYEPDFEKTFDEDVILTKMDYIIQGFSEKDADSIMHSKLNTVSIYHKEYDAKWKNLYDKKHMKKDRFKTIFQDKLTNEDIHKTTYYRIFELMIEELFNIFNFNYEAQKRLKTPFGYSVIPDITLSYKNKYILLDAKAYQASNPKQKKEITNAKEATEYFNENHQNYFSKRFYFIHLDNYNGISPPVPMSNILGYDFVNISVDFNSFIQGLYDYKTTGKINTLEEIKEHILNCVDLTK